MKFSFYILTLVLILSLVSIPGETFAQNNLRIFDDIGGGGGSSNQTSNNNDNTFIYVAGGLLIAGILAYALFVKKDSKDKSDTTASINSRLIYSASNNINSVSEQFRKAKDKIPVDFFLGIRNNEVMLNDKTYLLGLRLKL
ncbi:MAG: hypothetical protein WBQ32_05795 [Ignavibacteriaceae bacterium]